jgi:hypothetical protein
VVTGDLVNRRRQGGASDVSRLASPGRRRSSAWPWVTGALTAGAFAAAIVMAPAGSAPPALGLAWLLFVGSSAHVAATGWLYTLPEIRVYARQHPARLVRVPAALIGGSAVAAAFISPSLVAWCLLPYYAWQFFHFQKQNVGMAALAASARGVPSPRPAERRAVMTAGYAGIAALIAHPGLLQLGIGRDPLGPLYPAAAVVFAGALVAGVVALARRPAGDRAGWFCVIYLISLAFWIPPFVFGSPYAAVGGMTIAHGLQYLLLVGMVAAGNGQRHDRVVRLAVLCNIALAGGAVLSAASHLHEAAPAGRLLFGAYLGVVMAHFVIDAGLWRLRDPFPRAFLASRAPSLVPRAARSDHRLTMDRQPT